MDLGSFLQGFSGAFFRERQQAQQRADRAEESKLRENMLKSQLKLQELQQGRLEAEEGRKQAQFGQQRMRFNQEQQGREQIGQALTGSAPTVETEMGDQPIGNIPLSPQEQSGRMKQGLAMAAPAADLNNIFAPTISGSGTRVTSPGQIVFGPNGEVIAENRNKSAMSERMPFSTVDRVYLEARNEGMTHEQALVKAADTRRTFNAAGAQGTIDPKASPSNRETIRGFNQAASEGGAAGAAQVGAQRNRVGLQSSQFTVRTAEELLKQIPPPSEGLLGRGSNYVAQRYQEVAQTNPALARYESTKSAYATQLSRSVLAEKGTLTDMDRQVIVENFPGSNDTQKVREGKMNTLKQFIALIDNFEARIQHGERISDEDFRRQFEIIARRAGQFGPAPIAGAPAQPQSQPSGGAPDGTTQMLGGKRYIKRNGQWFQE